MFKIVTFLQLAAGGNGKFGPRKISFRPRAAGPREEKNLTGLVQVFILLP